MNTLIKVLPDPDGRFPHFIKHDAIIWRDMLLHGPRLNATVAYDVHVGTPSPAAADVPPNYARMIETLSTKRIDVVIFFPQETYACEIKPAAGCDAIGQALSYAHLFKAKFPEYPKVRPCIITDTAQPDISTRCVTFGVLLIETDVLKTAD